MCVLMIHHSLLAEKVLQAALLYPASGKHPLLISTSHQHLVSLTSD